MKLLGGANKPCEWKFRDGRGAALMEAPRAALAMCSTSFPDTAKSLSIIFVGRLGNINLSVVCDGPSYVTTWLVYSSQVFNQIPV